jgi:prepilin signal peptidase PulO-like enzyme (type II secretory pathway)
MTLSAFFVSVFSSLLLGFGSVLAWNHAPAAWICERGTAPEPAANQKLTAPIPSGLLFSLPFFIFLLKQDAPLSFGRFVPAAAVLFSLIQLTVCDIRYRILQDQWILFLAGAGLLFQVAAPARAAGLILPLGIYAACFLIARSARRPLGLGAGDAKLAAGLGFAFGAADMAAILCHASLLAGLWALFLLLTKKAAKGDRMAFGPFAALACCFYLLSI